MHEVDVLFSVLTGRTQLGAREVSKQRKRHNVTYLILCYVRKVDRNEVHPHLQRELEISQMYFLLFRKGLHRS